MSSYDFYLFNQQLPDNKSYRMVQNIVTLSNILNFALYYFILYFSPSSKESPYYKAIMHFQIACIFLFCLFWTFFIKIVAHLNFGFFYAEGYLILPGLTTALGYAILCVFYGSYGALVIMGLIFRLYLLVDHTHYLRTPCMLLIIFVVFEICFAIVTPVTFLMGQSDFDTKALPFNLTQEQLDYLISKTVISYTMRSLKQKFYPTYFLFLIAFCTLSCVCISYEIIRNVRKKQSLMSAGTTKHHLRVLKILMIQIAILGFISGCAPAGLALTLFIDLNSIIVKTCLVTIGFNSSVFSVLNIYLNPVLKKTFLKLPYLIITGRLETVSFLQSILYTFLNLIAGFPNRFHTKIDIYGIAN